MERKTISVIALDPRAARSYGRDVESLFGDVADISVFSVRDGTAMGALPTCSWPPQTPTAPRRS